jgi:phage shock protein PspC (stress-responsive transcriptional regulator)
MRHVGVALLLLIGVAAFGAVNEAIGQLPDSVGKGVAQDVDPTSEPWLTWFVRSVGLWGLLMLVGGAVMFVGACLVVFLGRYPENLAAFVLFLSWPFLIGIVAGVVAGITDYALIRKYDVPVTPVQLIATVLQSMLSPLRDAAVVSLPSYLVLGINHLIRSRFSATARRTRDPKPRGSTDETGSVKESNQPNES